MNYSIHKVITNLPRSLFTPEIVKEGIKHGDVGIIDYIPRKFMTEETLLYLIRKNKNSYESYDLRRIPKHLRSVDICEDAVRRQLNNFIYVPPHHKNTAMLDMLVDEAVNTIPLLMHVPEHLWTTGHVIRVINKLLYCSNYYHSVTDSHKRKLDLFLSFIPDGFKNVRMFYSLFDIESINAKELEFIIPNKFKQKEYYIRMARKNFQVIPKHKRTYDVILEGLLNGGEVMGWYEIRDKKGMYQTIFSMLDPRMADALVIRYPDYFKELPRKYRNERRLLLALQHLKDKSNENLLDKQDQHLYTPRVCRAIVQLDNGYPKFPAEVWTADFAKFCMENAPGYKWFEQVPKHLQTQEMVTAAIEKIPSNMKFASRRFISVEMAQRSYRHATGNRSVYFQPHYLTEFTKQTGLPVQFFGGETTFARLKEMRTRYTYTRVGNTYIGVYSTGRYGSSPTMVIMTRVTSRYMMPEKVFEVEVGMFHKTWLEKIISDNDPLFIKPTVAKNLRPVQSLSYYGVKELQSVEDIQMYANTFMDEVVGYCAVKDRMTYHDDTLDAALEGIQLKLGRIKVLDLPVGDDKVFTAEWLHQTYNYCYTGMTAFAEDYGLDVNGTYTLQQLKMVVKEQGIKQSIRSYRSELRKIKVIA